MDAHVLETECQQPFSDQAFYGQHDTPHDKYRCTQLHVATAQRVAGLAAAALARVAEGLISKHGEGNERRAVARSVADLDNYLTHSGGNCTSATLGSFDVAVATVLRRCCSASTDIAPLPASPVASAVSPSRRHRRSATPATLHLKLDTVYGGQEELPKLQQQQRRMPAASCPSSPTASPRTQRRARSSSVSNLKPIAAEPRASGSAFNILQMLAAPFQRGSRPSSPDAVRRQSHHHQHHHHHHAPSSRCRTKSLTTSRLTSNSRSSSTRRSSKVATRRSNLRRSTTPSSLNNRPRPTRATTSRHRPSLSPRFRSPLSPLPLALPQAVSGSRKTTAVLSPSVSSAFSSGQSFAVLWTTGRCTFRRMVAAFLPTAAWRN
eukprot:m.85383 g.85383  ORF g.85383 m.85383 type:complete len:378 (+) comp14844_c0_seq1:753-1886(+)